MFARKQKGDTSPGPIGAEWKRRLEGFEYVVPGVGRRGNIRRPAAQVQERVRLFKTRLRSELYMFA